MSFWKGMSAWPGSTASVIGLQLKFLIWSKAISKALPSRINKHSENVTYRQNQHPVHLFPAPGTANQCCDGAAAVAIHPLFVLSGFAGRIFHKAASIVPSIFLQLYHKHALVLKIIWVVHIHFHDVPLTASLPLLCMQKPLLWMKNSLVECSATTELSQ